MKRKYGLSLDSTIFLIFSNRSVAFDDSDITVDTTEVMAPLISRARLLQNCQAQEVEMVDHVRKVKYESYIMVLIFNLVI